VPSSGSASGPATGLVPPPPRDAAWWRDRLIIGVTYALAWAALLVNRGLYWDDWTFVGRTPADIVRTSWELGMPWTGYFHAALLATALPGLIAHILTFVTYLLSALILHAILCRLPVLSRMDALVATLTFALLPVNYARIALIDLQYGLSLLAFLGATWLLLRYLEDGAPARRLAALGLFVCSFSTASLLVLYVVPIAIAALVLWRSRRTSVWMVALRHADFLVLPVAYWVLKSTFFPPSGVYEGYNALTVQGLTQVPKALLAIPGQVLVEPLQRALVVAGPVGILAGVVVAIWLLRRSRLAEAGRYLPGYLLALVGAAVLALGVVAYLAVGRVPTIWDWSSRHQLLVPIGVGLLAAAAARGVAHVGRPGRAVGVVLIGMLLGVSAVADVSTLGTYQADWFKQTALIETMRGLPAVRDARHIRVIDEATAFNTLRRTYRFYEYNALLSVALGDTRRFASLADNEPADADIAQFIARPAYHMDQYVPVPVDLELTVSTAEFPDALQTLRLIVLEATDPAAFRREVVRLINLQATPVAGPALGG
jgi:hypothetical protein